MYVAVVAMIDEVWVVGERCFCAVFNDKKSVGVEVVVLEYQVGYVGDVLELVRWVGKYAIELDLLAQMVAYRTDYEYGEIDWMRNEARKHVAQNRGMVDVDAIIVTEEFGDHSAYGGKADIAFACNNMMKTLSGYIGYDGIFYALQPSSRDEDQYLKAFSQDYFLFFNHRNCI